MPSSNVWVESLGWMLIHSVWLIAVIVGMSAVGLRLMRQRSANARYLFGCVALLLSLCTLPAVLVWGLTRSVTPEEFGTLISTRSLTVRDGEAVDFDGSGKTIGIDGGPELQGEPVQIEVSTRRNSDGQLLMDVDVPRSAEARTMSPVELTAWEQAESWLRPHLALLVSGWLVGVVLLSVRPLIGWHSARRLQRVGLSEVSGSLQEMLSRLSGRLGLRRAVRLFQSSLVQIPCVVGAFKPVILLPASAIIGLSPAQLEALLAHELAHIRRHDFAMNVVQTLVETLLFYHPAIWWLSHRVRQEREHCCDDLAISVCGDVAGYARMLVSVEGLRGRVPQASVAASGGSLVERIRRLLPSPPEQTRSPWMTGFVVLATLTVLIGSWQWSVGQVSNLPKKDVAETRDVSAGTVQAVETVKAGHVENVPHKDWPQWGRTSLRNNVAEGPLPLEWDLKKGTNVVWKGKLGTSTYSSPVVSGGKVFVGTNNGAGLNPAHPKEKDMSCLVCFDEATGKFLWQYASEKLPAGRVHDWPMIGLCSTACVDGDRVWVVTNRCEVICLDANGFRDGENDGPFRDEPVQTETDADVIWKFDIFGELGVRPLHQSVSSITQVDGVLLLNTSNGPDESHVKIPAPNAPNFLALDAKTGRVIWKDNSAGESIVVGGSSCSCSGASPSVATLGGVTQAIFTGKEGWVYGYDFADLKLGKTTLLWQFDGNPKTAKYLLGSKCRRNTLMGSPVVADDRVYVATGHNPEHGEGDADLWCIDPTRRGDISSERVFNKSFENGEMPIPHKPLCACETDKGDFVRPNPNSGAIWHFAATDHNGNGKIEFEETFHRSLGSPVIHDGMLFIADASGLLHCLDSKTGAGQWTHDLTAAVYSTCLIADGHVLIGDEDGDLEILKAARTKQSLFGDTPPNFGSSIYATPAVVDGTLFIATKDALMAIRDAKQSIERDDDKSKTGDPLKSDATDSGSPRRANQTQVVERGVAFLKAQQQPDGFWNGTRRDGVTALCVAALLQAGVKPDDPILQKSLAALRKVEPTFSYTVALQTMVLCAASPKADAELIRRNVTWLEQAQVTEGPHRGAWRYGVATINHGDGSCSRFALLGLQAAARAGFDVKAETWRKASEYYLSSQNSKNHGWGYVTQSGPTPSMTLAAIAGLAIINQRLPQNEHSIRRSEAIERAVPYLESNAAQLWQAGHGFYALHGLERAAHLNGWTKLGQHELSNLLDAKLTELQRPDGSWAYIGGGVAGFDGGGEQTKEQKEAAANAAKLERQSNDLIATSFALLALTGQLEPKLVGRKIKIEPRGPMPMKFSNRRIDDLTPPRLRTAISGGVRIEVTGLSGSTIRIEADEAVLDSEATKDVEFSNNISSDGMQSIVFTGAVKFFQSRASDSVFLTADRLFFDVTLNRLRVEKARLQFKDSEVTAQSLELDLTNDEGTFRSTSPEKTR